MALSADEQKVIDEAPNQLLIGGEWRDSSEGAKLEIEDPATGETICEVADGTPLDYGRAELCFTGGVLMAALAGLGWSVALNHGSRSY